MVTDTPRTLLLAITLGLTATVAVGSDAGTTWTGRLDLSDDSRKLELSVPAEGSSGAAFPARFTGTGGERELSIEEWEREGDVMRFRLVGLDRSYRFSGSRDGDIIAGTLEREALTVPSTDLYLVEIEPLGDAWSVGAVESITDRDGYDNQPCFVPDGRSVLYTSIRDDQADIYRFELADRSIRRLTTTAESEYSPTPMPGGEGFSTVRVEADGTQRLWAFDAEGDNPRLLLESIAPVGYHAWLDPSTLALFVLGEPATLQIAELGTGNASVADADIGRSLHRAPDGGAVTYISKSPADGWTIRSLALDGGGGRDLAPTRPEREDFLWTPSGKLLMGDDSRLFVAEPDTGAWREVADLSDRGVRGITRLALSPDGRRLVVVGTRADRSTLPERIPLELSRVP